MLLRVIIRLAYRFLILVLWLKGDPACRNQLDSRNYRDDHLKLKGASDGNRSRRL
jgi:hypothetical protein